MGLSVFALMCLGIVGSALFCNLAAQRNIYSNVAVQAAQGVVEQVRGTSFGLLKTAASTPGKTVPIVYYRPAYSDGKKTTAGSVVTLDMPVNGVDYTPLDGVFINADLDASGNATRTVKMNFTVRVLMTPDTSGRADGLAVDVMYRYDSPSGSGGFKPVSGVLRSYVSNTIVE